MRSILKETIAIALLLISIAATKAQVTLTATAGTTTGSYTTLNAAFAAINAGTHQGAINISITANTTEPSPPTSLVGSGVGSASYTSIYISPTVGSWTVNSSAVPFAYRGIIELFGAQHVTIDGDPAGTGSRNLTFKMTMTSNLSTSVIRLGSTDTFGLHGAAYDTIRNCNIIGGRDSANSNVANYGIIATGNSTTSISTPVAYGCSYNAFVNNTFTRSYYAIYLLGGGITAAHGNSNTLIMKNYFGSDSATTSNIYCIDMNTYNNMNGTNIGIIDSNDFTGTLNNYSFYGISIFNTYGNTTIQANNFHDITTSAGILGYYGIFGAFNPVTAPLTFSGNTMQNCSSNSASNGLVSLFYGYGDGILACKWDIYDNTVNNIVCPRGGSVVGIMVTNDPGNSFAPDTLYCHNNIITNLSAQLSAIGIACPEGGKVYDNIVSGIATQDSISFACGMYVKGTAYNNMIGNITAAPRATIPSPSYGSAFLFTNGFPATAVGISGDGDFYENSIALNTANQPGSNANAFSAAYFGNLYQGKLQDNIFYNSQNSINAFGFYCAISSYFSTDTLDYNEYYVPYGNVGYASSTQTSLLDWQAATGQDLHSVSGLVPFISTTNLHIDTLNAAANNVFRNGTYITSVPADIDGQTRNNPPCIGADEFYAVNPLPDSLVWPGDADNNRVVDNNDLLPIGLAYDSTGLVRTVTGNVWQGDIATNWVDNFSVYLPTVNFNHADCNGDGIINADDTLAIVTNFGDIHAKTNSYNGVWRSGIPGITIAITPDTTLNGAILTSNIYLGDSATPVSNIYGLAFTYNYDPLVVDTNTVSFAFIPSWIGSSTNSININKNFNAGQVKAAITGIDHIARSGNGQIATFTAVITTGNINGKDLSYYTDLNYISDITAIDQYGNLLQLNAGIDSNYIGYTPNGIDPVSALTKISICPNPASASIRVSADANITGVTITDVLGETVASIAVNNKKKEVLDISALAEGVYIVHASSVSGSATTKLVISR